MKSVQWHFKPPPQASMPEGPSSSGRANPMPYQTPSLTPAWDPSSCTPGFFVSITVHQNLMLIKFIGP